MQLYVLVASPAPHQVVLYKRIGEVKKQTAMRGVEDIMFYSIQYQFARIGVVPSPTLVPLTDLGASIVPSCVPRESQEVAACPVWKVWGKLSRRN